MRLVHQARSRTERGWITPLLAIMGYRASTTSASIETRDHRCQHLAEVPVEGIDFAPFALDSAETA
jgi:hypothetical protein